MNMFIKSSDFYPFCEEGNNLKVWKENWEPYGSQNTKCYEDERTTDGLENLIKYGVSEENSLL